MLGHQNSKKLTQNTLRPSFYSNKIFKNFPILPYFYQFSQSLRCVIIQTNMNFLISQRNGNIFTQKTRHCSFVPLKNQHFSTQRFLETSAFTKFVVLLAEVEVCIIHINTNFRKNQQKINSFTPGTSHSSLFPKNSDVHFGGFQNQSLLITFLQQVRC